MQLLIFALLAATAVEEEGACEPLLDDKLSKILHDAMSLSPRRVRFGVVPDDHSDDDDKRKEGDDAPTKHGREWRLSLLTSL